MVDSLLTLAKAEVRKDGNTAVITVPTSRAFFRTNINKLGQDIATKYGCTKFRLFISDQIVEEDLKPTEFTCNILSTIDDLVGVVDKIIATNQPYSLDFETTSLNTYEAKIVGVGLSSKAGTFYAPIVADSKDYLPESSVMFELERLIKSNLLLVIHNAKYELRLLKRFNIHLKWQQYYDTQLPIHMEDPVNKKGLKKAVKKIFHIEMEEYEDLTGKGKKQITFDKVPVQQAARYCGADAYYTLKLYHHYQDFFGPEQTKLLEWDRRLVEVVIDMEERGILLDKEFFKQLEGRVTRRIKRLEKAIHIIAGTEFNIGSTKQLGAILYEKLAITAPKLTDKGNYCTDDKTLKSLPDCKIVRHLKSWRTHSKIASTYLTLPDNIQPETGRVHGSFNQNGTGTGRFSSSDPNLQNIPVKTALGRLIRHGIVAAPGNKLVGADYSQVEVRIFAVASKDKDLLQAFKDGEDVHKKIAAKIFNKELDQVTSDDRRVGKTLNFAILYMQGAYSTAEQLSIERDEAEVFHAKYKEAIPTLDPLIERTKELARKQGYIKTMFGRRRYFPNINSKNWKKRAKAEREAFNAPIQGTAADIMRMAMVAVNDKLRADSRYDGIYIIMTVHDELVIECPEAMAEEIKAMMTDTMENIVDIGVKLEVDAKIADNYGDLK